jgi:hypothetical protein
LQVRVGEAQRVAGGCLGLTPFAFPPLSIGRFSTGHG